MISETQKKVPVQEDSPVAASAPIKISEDDFAAKVFDFRSNGKWNYIGNKPCIVDFYADWCGPCKMIAPYLDELAETYSGKLYVYKVNTDHAQELSAFFGVRSIPAVMFCPMKGEYKFVVGANSKDTYKSLVESFLKVK